jgi:AcrR family transcriptional regulator
VNGPTVLTRRSAIIADVADARGPATGELPEAAELAEAAEHRRRAGRPRLRPASNAGVPPREEILDAAAGLFVSQGLAATTTRQIAERVGIRQASLYYHFSGKDEILLELLTQSVRPSLRAAATLESRCRDDPAAGLYALALTDVRTLSRAPHNIATLYLMPEVQGQEFASFRAERSQLQAAYGRLGHAAAGQAAAGQAAARAPGRSLPGQAPAAAASLDEALIAALVMQLVESVIHLRRSGELRESHAHDIAASCLRLIGLAEPDIARARDTAATLDNTATPSASVATPAADTRT